MKHLFTIVGFLSVFLAHAQHPSYWQLNEDSGLPSNTVYDLFQDTKGYIWFGTDKGLVRYNGQSFQTYSSSRQKSVSLTHIQEDKAGRIWSVNFSKQVFYTDGDSLIELDLQLGELADAGGHINILLLGSKLVVYSYHHVNILNLETNEWQRDFYKSEWPKHKNGKKKLLYSVSGNGEDFGLVFSNEVHLANFDETKSQLHFNATAKFHRSVWFNNSVVLIPHKFTPLVVCNLNDADTSSISVDYPEHSESTRVLTSCKDRKDRLWICTSDGARAVSNGNPDQLILRGHQVSKVLLDQEGSLWISTLQHGVFVIPNEEVLVYNEANSELRTSELNAVGIGLDGRLATGSFDGFIQHINQDGSVSEPLDFGIRKEVNGFVKFDNQAWAYGDQLYSLTKNKSYLWERPISVKQVQPLGESVLGIVSSEGLAFSNLETTPPSAPNIPIPARSEILRDGIQMNNQGIRALEYDTTTHTFYAASRSGLFKYESGKEIELKTKEGKSIYSLGLQKDDNGVLWVSTVSNGLLAFKDTAVAFAFKEDFFGEKLQFSKLAVDGNEVWLASNKGLYRVKPHTKEFERFDRLDGLPTNGINDLAIKDGFVWLATMKGLVKIPQTLTCLNLKLPRLNIVNKRVNQQERGDVSSLAYTENNLTLELSPIGFRNQGEGTIKYRLVGISDAWNEVQFSQPIIRYLALAPGEYRFEAIAVNEDGVESEMIVEEFEITPPFWQTWWFYLLIGATLVFTVSGIFAFRSREIRKRDAVQHDLRVSELTALKAQMNPHFVFNALNSIQDYVLMNQTKLANDYLGKFARLMRKTLDQSQQLTVSLSEEIELLKLYLDLEAIRFEDGFEYKIEIDASVSVEQIELPSMIVQPFVENAIKHGLMHKKDDRKLLVKFEMQEQILVCKIEDNGIGLNASKKLNEKRKDMHRSFGTSAVNKRLELLNVGRKEQINVEMTDVSDQDKGTSGTHVLLRIPILTENKNA